MEAKATPIPTPSWRAVLCGGCGCNVAPTGCCHLCGSSALRSPWELLVRLREEAGGAVVVEMDYAGTRIALAAEHCAEDEDGNEVVTDEEYAHEDRDPAAAFWGFWKQLPETLRRRAV